MTDTDNREQDDSVRSYKCPECGSDDEWMIQNHIAPAAAYFDPKITHVKCSKCGYIDEAETTSLQSHIQKGMEEWMEEHSNRFVVPEMEYWPDRVCNKKEAIEYYSEKATGHILNSIEDND